ncbi:MAG TPA: FAD-dependent oxidoreductase [Steroidobacteraceae bacterium]|jgi:2-polyprenyl-6-methoxyphenol hydroxylase-like FAD-dependent oxidoreductase
MAAPPADPNHTDVIIVGAGPTGLTLACDLARRGVPFRIVDKAAEPFTGSRGKGVQPRTLEVFDDLGVVEELLSAGSPYPRMNAHVWFLDLKWHMHKQVQATPDVPYSNVWLVPQWRTEKILRDRLERLGYRVEQGVEIVALEQDEAGASVQLRREGQVDTAAASYVVAADGGRSFVRKSLGIKFTGSSTEQGGMIVGDLRADGLSRSYWHVWPAAKGGGIGLCPLPNSDLFQLMMQLRPSDDEPVLSEQVIQSRWLAGTRLKNIHLHDPTWLSLFRPNVRMVDRYRVGRVFLAGDAAHVHPPAGAQGLNTGVQDAYNLGWKLAMALKGAPASLLDSYQEERLPVAAGVLGRSMKLYQSRGVPKRGDAERQLLLNYRGSSLTLEIGWPQGKLRAGDRAPDAICQNSSGRIRLFDLFRGPHFTLLAFGAQAAAAIRDLEWTPADILRKCCVRLSGIAEEDRTIIDADGNAHAAYGTSDKDNVVFLLRPDGYIGLIASRNWMDAVNEYQKAVACVQHDR